MSSSTPYHEEAETGINKQINLELYTMYTYLSMVRNLPINYLLQSMLLFIL